VGGLRGGEREGGRETEKAKFDNHPFFSLWLHPCLHFRFQVPIPLSSPRPPSLPQLPNPFPSALFSCLLVSFFLSSFLDSPLARPLWLGFFFPRVFPLPFPFLCLTGWFFPFLPLDHYHGLSPVSLFISLLVLPLSFWPCLLPSFLPLLPSPSPPRSFFLSLPPLLPFLPFLPFYTSLSSSCCPVPLMFLFFFPCFFVFGCFFACAWAPSLFLECRLSPLALYDCACEGRQDGVCDLGGEERKGWREREIVEEGKLLRTGGGVFF